MKHLRIILLIFIGFISQTIDAQKYAVYFTDKNNTPYSTDDPLAFLSQKALDRRAKFNIQLTNDDLPVNPDYLEQIKNEGATILFSSRWLNFTLVQCDDGAINHIKTLPCVDSVVFVYPYQSIIQPQKEKPVVSNNHPPLKKYDPFYGNASNQIEQINGIKVHEKGYEGDGVLIAVLDGGFCNVNTISAFAHLYESGQLLMAKDFIEPNGDIYRSDISGHGTSVLSCMAAYLPNQMVGTAPKASYCLFRTEDTSSEYIIEEYTWVIGAEAADSIGADLINSSLGYTKYDDPTMSHSYSDMDGKTTIISIGAQKAVERGVFVCNSAGNEGNSTWQQIVAPADVAEVLTVGAVQQNGQYAAFSSIGPNAAGEQKPNVVAQGAAAAIINSSGAVTTGSGTSYSSPIICGMVACLLQASPFTKPESLKNAIEAASNFYTTPSYQIGYGIPDFYKVLQSLPVIEHSKCNNILIYPNPTSSDMLTVKSKIRLKKALLYDVTGQLVAEQTLSPYDYKIPIQNLSAGMYVIHFYDDNEVAGCAKFVKE